MNQIIRLPQGNGLPVLIGGLPESSQMRFVDFVTANIRKAYAQSMGVS